MPFDYEPTHVLAVFSAQLFTLFRENLKSPRPIIGFQIDF